MDNEDTSSWSFGESQARARSDRVVRRWSPEEHQLLERLVAEMGSERRWSQIALRMPGRTGKQCRERWLNHLQPNTKKGSWTQDEELKLCQWHSILGSHWSKIALKLPGRTENNVKNLWNAAYRSKSGVQRPGPLGYYVALIRAGNEPHNAFLSTLSAYRPDGLEAARALHAALQPAGGSGDAEVAGDPGSPGDGLSPQHHLGLPHHGVGAYTMPHQLWEGHARADALAQNQSAGMDFETSGWVTCVNDNGVHRATTVQPAFAQRHGWSEPPQAPWPQVLLAIGRAAARCMAAMDEQALNAPQAQSVGGAALAATRAASPDTDLSTPLSLDLGRSEGAMARSLFGPMLTAGQHAFDEECLQHHDNAPACPQIDVTRPAHELGIFLPPPMRSYSLAFPAHAAGVAGPLHRSLSAAPAPVHYHGPSAQDPPAANTWSVLPVPQSLGHLSMPACLGARERALDQQPAAPPCPVPTRRTCSWLSPLCTPTPGSLAAVEWLLAHGAEHGS